jgi:signal transduction histidine kinase
MLAGFISRGCRSERRFRAVLRVGAVFALIAPHVLVYEQTPNPPPVRYRTAVSILSLSPEEASHGEPARIRGVVTRSTDFGLVVQDRTAGIYVGYQHPGAFAPGDDVEVNGVVDPGQFAPTIKAQSIRKLGRAPLPRPKEVTFKQLSTGDETSQYVSITGEVRSAGLRATNVGAQRFWLQIAMADGFVYISLPKEDADTAGKLVDAVVRVDGAASSTRFHNRQINAPTLYVAGMQSIAVLRPPHGNLFALPLTPISRLMQYRSGTDYYHRVRVAGTVTYFSAGESLILEDGGRALFVTTAQAPDIKLGDRVEAVGFPAPRDSGPVLEDAVLRDIAPGQPLQPARVTLADLSTGSFNYNLVSTEGRFLRRVQEPYREVLLLQDKSTLLLAELTESENSNALQKLQEGSTIRISGISIVDITGTWNTGGPGASAVRYKILLRSASDVQVIQPPSWWTMLHVIYIAAVLGVLMLFFVGLEIYSRIERWRLQAVLDERERLAHEIHDTLAQSFAGIGYQLQAIRKAIPTEIPRLTQQVDLARELVRHSHKEARRSIEPLSLEASKEIDLLSSLEISARKMVEGGAVEVITTSAGTPRPIPPDITASLLRIGQEAIANAVRHADPSHLEISVSYEKHVVRLVVRDNGCGFVKSGDLLGFGLRGMRKRSASLSAKLEIFSHPGEGTSVEVAVPLPPDLTLFTFFQRTWRFLLERILHVYAENQ